LGERKATVASFDRLGERRATVASFDRFAEAGAASFDRFAEASALDDWSAPESAATAAPTEIIPSTSAPAPTAPPRRSARARVAVFMFRVM